LTRENFTQETRNGLILSYLCKKSIKAIWEEENRHISGGYNIFIFPDGYLAFEFS